MIMLVTVPVVMPMICAYNVEVDLDVELQVGIRGRNLRSVA